jgi:hypothetical protein
MAAPWYAAAWSSTGIMPLSPLAAALYADPYERQFRT